MSVRHKTPEERKAWSEEMRKKREEKRRSEVDKMVSEKMAQPAAPKEKPAEEPKPPEKGVEKQMSKEDQVAASKMLEECDRQIAHYQELLQTLGKDVHQQTFVTAAVERQVEAGMKKFERTIMGPLADLDDQELYKAVRYALKRKGKWESAEDSSSDEEPPKEREKKKITPPPPVIEKEGPAKPNGRGAAGGPAGPGAPRKKSAWEEREDELFEEEDGDSEGQGWEEEAPKRQPPPRGREGRQAPQGGDYGRYHSAADAKNDWAERYF